MVAMVMRMVVASSDDDSNSGNIGDENHEDSGCAAPSSCQQLILRKIYDKR
jgi:hypothetical protein